MEKVTIPSPKERPITTKNLACLEDYSESARRYGIQANCNAGTTVIRLEPESVLKALASAKVNSGYKADEPKFDIPVASKSTDTQRFLHSAFNILNEAKKLKDSLFQLISKASMASSVEDPQRAETVQKVLAELAA